jgi:predicted amidohydrolase YtcJ
VFNGRIFTGTEPSFVEAVLIRGSRVIAIGSTEEVAATAGADARRIDLAGRPVIPGINDAHLHMDFFVPEHTPLQFENIDPPCSLVLDRVTEAVGMARKENAIIGAIGQTAFFEEACTAQTLDRLAPEHAVILHTWTPHAAILKRSAVKMFSIHTANPPTGRSYGKDGRSRKVGRRHPGIRLL